MKLDTSWTAALASLDIREDGARRDLVAEAERVRVGAGTVIIAQDEADDRVFLLLGGRARVVLLSENGQEIWLDAFGSGAVFGELAALTGAPRISGIIAESDCDLAIYDGTEFFGLVRRHGEIGLALAKLLARRVQHTTQRMFELSALSAPGRIYAELLRMSRPVGSDGTARVIEPAPSMKELAMRVNSTRETASRTINNLQRKGLLEKLNGRIELVDPDQLDRLRGSS
ncbi:Crp/Fnr family transcriptional regulator [Maricaulis sp.]|uniref:Crp/Fnr family transcriptional regulator n=1 Tax=Maricaulis sp. TaxID=1486257 RepID=UPI002B26F65B|nr:Crp/Fnr family transcriptional regulator [Maricaulis sp.]